jgi:uncharacterized membrane protein YeaQ/YmgE (transglycosylase-associated protein family)
MKVLRAGITILEDTTTYLGQVVGWYHAGEGAGLIGAIVGAVIVLLIWGYFTRGRTTVT